MRVLAYIGIFAGTIGLLVGYLALKRHDRVRYQEDRRLQPGDINYRMAQLVVRQLELVQRADEVMPVLTEAQRAENERLIRAFYDNQLPEGD